MTTSPDPAQRRAERGAKRLVGWLAVVAHLLLGLPTATLGLVVPVAVHLLLVAMWLGLGLGLVVLPVRPQRPLLALAVPIGYVVLVVTVITAGEALLGWTA